MPKPDQILSFFNAIVDLYRVARGQLLPQEVVEERFAICQVCPHFDGRGCVLCGCCTGKRKTLFNKLTHPTQECPDGRWSKRLDLIE